ncbi:hypothetical protein GKODMF_05345 [Candidatus Electrothrix gigas]
MTKLSNRYIHSISIETTKQCNLRCKYCYLTQCGEEPKGRYSNLHMSLETGRAVVDFLFNNSPDKGNCGICFIGGEPLLNWELIEDLVEYGKKIFKNPKKKLRFSITTNGLALTEERIQYILKNKMGMTLDFDGLKNIQDKLRPLASQKGSYDKTVANFEAIRRLKGSLSSQFTIRATVTRNELDLIKIADSIEALGFTHCALTPVTASDETQDFAIKEEDVPLLLSYYTALADRFYERIVAGKHEPVSWFHKFLRRILYSQKFNVACGGGRGYIGVSVDGGCYICHRFFGAESGYMGNIRESLDRSFTEKIESSKIDDRSECGKCWAKRYCGGPCYFEADFHHQDFFTPNPIYCAIIRHSIQESFKLYSKLLKNHPEIIEKMISLRKNIQPDRFSIQSCQQNANDESLLPDSARPVQRNGVQFHSVDDELLLYDAESQHVSTVNQSAKAIWDYCDGQNDILTISERLTEQFDCNPADIFPDVCRAINHFEKIGFVELT